MQLEPSTAAANAATEIFFEARYLAIGKRLGEGLFNELAKSNDLRPSLTTSRILAFLIAGVVHIITILFPIAGIWLAVKAWPDLVGITASLILLGIAWLLRPHFAKMPEGRGVLPRESFPVLYKLADQIADLLGMSPLDAIVITGDFNAAYTEVGIKRKKIVYLGLPLLAVLEPQELVALLSHEFAHGVNSDATRSFFVGNAIISLVNWCQLLMPSRFCVSSAWVLLVPFALMSGMLWVAIAGLQTAVRFLEILVLVVPAGICFLALYGLAHLLLNALAHLLWRDMQRAEYLADDLAAHASGTDAVLQMLEKLHLSGAFYSTLQNVSLNRKQGLFEALQKRIAELPRTEMVRIQREERLPGARLDFTHPPTGYRIDMLRAHYAGQAKVVLTAEDFAQIQEEIRPFQGLIERGLLELHEDILYV